MSLMPAMRNSGAVLVRSLTLALLAGLPLWSSLFLTATHAANSAFNFRACAKYGYARPKGLRDFSTNQWNATNTACKLLTPAFFAEAKKANPKVSLSGSLRTECGLFLVNYPNPVALEQDLRANNHPIP